MLFFKIVRLLLAAVSINWLMLTATFKGMGNQAFLNPQVFNVLFKSNIYGN